MRIGAFMLGGIIGAAAVVYLTRNNNMMTMSSMNQPGQMLSSAMGNARQKIQDTAMKAMDMTMNRSSQKAADMQQVEQIVNEDPALKQQVDEIINTSSRSH